jgi:hypothetical protein
VDRWAAAARRKERAGRDRLNKDHLNNGQSNKVQSNARHRPLLPDVDVDRALKRFVLDMQMLEPKTAVND